MNQSPRFLGLCALLAGALGPAVVARPAHGASPPGGEPREVLPRSTSVLRAVADDDAVFACVYDGRDGPRTLVRAAAGRVVTLRDPAPRIDALALDRERVYWVGADGVASLARSGLGEVNALAGRDAALFMKDPDSASRRAVAVDGDSVYFSVDDAIGRVPRGGGPVERLAEGPQAMLVAADHGEVLWLEKQRVPDGADVEDLVVTPERGGTSRPLLEDVPGLLAVAIDGDGVFWLHETAQAGRGAIERTSRRSGETTTVLGDVPVYYAHVLAAAGATLVWLDYPDGLHGAARVRAMPEEGGEVTTLAEAFPPANGLVVAGDLVLWSGEGSRVVERRSAAAAVRQGATAASDLPRE